MRIWGLKGSLLRNFSDLHLIVIVETNSGQYQGYFVRPKEKVHIPGGRIDLVSILRYCGVDHSVIESEKDGEKGITIQAHDNGVFVLPGDPRTLATGPVTYVPGNGADNFGKFLLGDDWESAEPVSFFLKQKEDGSIPVEGVDYVVMSHQNHIEQIVDDDVFWTDEYYEEYWKLED